MQVKDLIARLSKLNPLAIIVDPDEDPNEYMLDFDIRDAGEDDDGNAIVSVICGPIDRG